MKDERGGGGGGSWCGMIERKMAAVEWGPSPSWFGTPDALRPRLFVYLGLGSCRGGELLLLGFDFGEVLLLGFLDHGDEGFDFADGFGAAPEEDPVDVPVAAVEGAAFEVVDGFAEDQDAVDEGAADERLAADVEGLVLERFAFVFGQKHGRDLRI
jgi:hypothetical protein